MEVSILLGAASFDKPLAYLHTATSNLYLLIYFIYLCCFFSIKSLLPPPSLDLRRSREKFVFSNVSLFYQSAKFFARK